MMVRKPSHRRVRVLKVRVGLGFRVRFWEWLKIKRFRSGLDLVLGFRFWVLGLHLMGKA